MPFKGYALIIAISQYLNLEAKDQLPATLHDAQLFANFLTARAGYSRDHVLMLTDDKATKPGIMDGLKWLAEQATPDSVAVIYFSGHGVRPSKDPSNTTSYLCPSDVEPTGIAAGSIAAQDFSAAVSKVKSARRLVFLDACHAGGVRGGDEHFIGGMSAGVNEAAYALNSTQGQAVFSSCKQDEKSYMTPDGQNSLFTACLVDVLGGSYNNQGSDAYVLLSNLMEGLGKEVPKRCAASGPAVCGGQHPYFRIEGENFPVTLINPQIAASKGITEENAVETQDPTNKDATAESSSQQVTGLAAKLLPEERDRINIINQQAGRDAINIQGGGTANTGSGTVNNFGGVQGPVNTGSGSQTTISMGDVSGISGTFVAGSGNTVTSSGNPPPASPQFNSVQLRSLMRSKITADNLADVIFSISDYSNLRIDRTQLGANLADQVIALFAACRDGKALDALVSSLSDNGVLTDNLAGWHTWAQRQDRGGS